MLTAQIVDLTGCRSECFDLHVATQHLDAFEFEYEHKTLDLYSSNFNEVDSGFPQHTTDAISTETCTSATSSFSFKDVSYLSFNSGRRTSFDSSSDMLETPTGSIDNPVTPVSFVATHSIPPLSLSCKRVCGDITRPTSMLVKRDSSDDEDDQWMVVDYDSPPCKTEFADKYRHTSRLTSHESSDEEDAKWAWVDKGRFSSERMIDLKQPHGVGVPRSNDFFLSSAANSLQSSVLFDNQVPNVLNSGFNDCTPAWKSSSPNLYPGTIAPHTMLRLPASVLPSTPMRGFGTLLTYDDSPMSTTPDHFILPSQRDVDVNNDVESDSGASFLSSPKTPNIKEHVQFKLAKDADPPEPVVKNQRAARASRLHHERKRCIARSQRRRKPPGETKTDRVSVIESNRYTCKFPGCDKGQDGRPQTFKRMEHKKRHERTVWHKGMDQLIPEFVCWVESCSKIFSRHDNLQTHLKNCHGCKSATRTKSYYATLDRTSQFYRPSWQGEVDENGEPLNLTEFYGLEPLRSTN